MSKLPELILTPVVAAGAFVALIVVWHIIYFIRSKK
jgi:hypothetical protein